MVILVIHRLYIPVNPDAPRICIQPAAGHAGHAAVPYFP